MKYLILINKSGKPKNEQKTQRFARFLACGIVLLAGPSDPRNTSRLGGASDFGNGDGPPFLAMIAKNFWRLSAA